MSEENKTNDDSNALNPAQLDFGLWLIFRQIKVNSVWKPDTSVGEVVSGTRDGRIGVVVVQSFEERVAAVGKPKATFGVVEHWIFAKLKTSEAGVEFRYQLQFLHNTPSTVWSDAQAFTAGIKDSNGQVLPLKSVFSHCSDAQDVNWNT